MVNSKTLHQMHTSIHLHNRTYNILVVLAVVLSLASANFYFEEVYEDEISASDRWVQPTSDVKNTTYTVDDIDYFVDQRGQLQWNIETELLENEELKDQWWGFKAIGPGKYFSALSNDFQQILFPGQDDLILQFIAEIPVSVNYGNVIVKLLPEDLNPEQFTRETPFYLKFGPRTGGDTKFIFEIFQNGKHGIFKKHIRPPHDGQGHLFKLIVRTDNSYEIYVDNAKKDDGSIIEDFEWTETESVVPETIGSIGIEADLVGEVIHLGYMMLANNEMDATSYQQYIIDSIATKKEFEENAKILEKSMQK